MRGYYESDSSQTPMQNLDDGDHIFLFSESNSLMTLSLPKEMTADFMRQQVQYRCMAKSTKAIVSKYRYYQWMMYHSSVGRGLLMYTFESRQKGNTMILRQIQLKKSMKMIEPVTALLLGMKASKYTRLPAMKMSLASWTMRIITPAVIQLHIMENRIRLAAMKWWSIHSQYFLSLFFITISSNIEKTCTPNWKQKYISSAGLLSDGQFGYSLQIWEHAPHPPTAVGNQYSALKVRQEATVATEQKRVSQLSFSMNCNFFSLVSASQLGFNNRSMDLPKK